MDKEPKKLILLADDEPEILDLYSSVLIKEGMDVVTAINGLECVDLAKSRKPDLILLDLKMPVMDGVEALSKLKEDPQLKNIRVIFLTAFSDPKFVGIDSKFAKEIGADDFIKKGIGLDEFIQAVKKYLG